MNLEKLRHEKRWSQEYVARQMEVSRATVDNWEKGRTEPTITAARKLASLFGITMEELLK